MTSIDKLEIEPGAPTMQDRIKAEIERLEELANFSDDERQKHNILMAVEYLQASLGIWGTEYQVGAEFYCHCPSCNATGLPELFLRRR
jgi:hypothetical protein